MTAEQLIPDPNPENWTVMDKAGGVRFNILWEHPDTGASIAIVEVPEGEGIPSRHVHASNQFMYCLEGEYEYLEPAPGIVLLPGSLYWNPKGNPHGPTRAHRFTRLLEIYDGPHYFETPEFHSEETVGRVDPGARS
jgi:2,4'-dihydroxyacetophenone dioxygenase